ncbi:uncharacterized protein FRV6_02772 [Fusarium oxysporum]|uniref:Uncharacterized protein n=1 Tax=Fusarium oxysporum TaxID=5507 RepID=A0A2H3STM8_FUSOX|nr:uncharacterized protein FRV6_02772 [Fusarium oxysporum]
MIKITRYLSDVVCDSTTTAINKIWPDANQAIAKVKSGDSILVGGFGFSGVPAMLINSIRDRKDLGEFAGVSNNAGYLALDLVSTMGCSSMLLKPFTFGPPANSDYRVTVAQAVKPQGKRSGHNRYASNHGCAIAAL